MPATEDPLTPVHKGLRGMIYNLSTRLQTLDFTDAETTQALLTDLENDFTAARSAGCALCILSMHANDEESVVFPPAARAGNALITSLIREHQELTRRELAIAAAGHRLQGLPSPADRRGAGAELNRAANELFAAYLTHMNREETELVPLMQAHFTDEQLLAMRATIVGRMPPERLLAILGWMLPNLNDAELTGLLGGLRRGAPPPFVAAVSRICEAKIEPTRWAVVRERVGF